MGIGYTTRTYRRTPQHAGGALAVLVGADPTHPRPAAMLAVEGDRWTLTLGGYAGYQRDPSEEAPRRHGHDFGIAPEDAYLTEGEFE